MGNTPDQIKVLFIASGGKANVAGPIIQNQADSLKNKQIDLSIFLIKGRGFSGYLKAIFLLRKKLKKEKSDLIHAHYALCGFVGLMSKRRTKLVVSFMGDDLIGSCKPDGSIIFISQLFVRLNFFLIRFIYDHSIVKCEGMIPKSFFHRKNISIIPNGINIKSFNPVLKADALEKLNWDIGFKHIIFAANPQRAEKNYRLSSEAVNLLNDKSIILHTVYNVSNSDMIYYYNAADLLLMTSFHEGSPNVVKEAMACNCPVVSTDVGDLKWLFGNIPGYFITTYDTVDIAEKIKLALEFRQKHVQTNGREQIINLGLDSDTVSEKITEVYKKVLAQ